MDTNTVENTNTQAFNDFCYTLDHLVSDLGMSMPDALQQGFVTEHLLGLLISVTEARLANKEEKQALLNSSPENFQMVQDMLAQCHAELARRKAATFKDTPAQAMDALSEMNKAMIKRKK